VVGEFYSQLTGGRTAPATITSTQTVTTTGTLQEVTTVTATSVSITGSATATITVTSTKDPSIDLQATQLLYYGGYPVTLFGTITPPPSSTQGVVMMTRNPQGVVVDVGQAQVSSATGSFSYVIGAGGTINWQQGQYSATATAGSKAATTAFYFTPSQAAANPPPLSVLVLAPQLASPGAPIDVGVLATLQSGAPDDMASWSTLAVLFPDGSFHNVCAAGAPATGCTGTLTRIQLGFYQLVFNVPQAAQQGTYFIEAAGSDSTGNSARGLGEFSIT
jgi:hypothetical protein